MTMLPCAARWARGTHRARCSGRRGPARCPGGAVALLALVLSVLLGSLSLAACGGQREPDGSPSASSPAALHSLAPGSQDEQLRRALLGRLARQLTVEARSVALGGNGPRGRTPAERRLARHPAISRLAHDYFATEVLAHTPGAAGERGRRELARFFPPGSAALARARYLALGTQGELATARDGSPAVDPTRASVVVVRDLTLGRAGRRATVVVWPVVEYQVWFDASGRLRWGCMGGKVGVSRRSVPSGPPHRLRLVKRARGWLIRDDFSLDAEVPACLKRGGAPAAVWRGERRRIESAVRRHFAVSPGIRATLERLTALLNQRRFGATGRLFADGVGLRSSAFQHPGGSWRVRLVSANRYNPLSLRAVADPGVTSVAVRIAGPRDLLTAGGGALSGLWTLRRSSSGRWLITGYGAAEFGAPQ